MKQLCLLLCLFIASSTALLANLTQSNWRWHNNDGDQAAATWKAVQNTAVTISDYKAIRLRVAVYNNTSDTKYFNHQLQYATSMEGPWITLSESSAINAFNLAGDNTLIRQGDKTSEQLTDPQDGTSYIPGIVITGQDQLTDTLLNNTRTEYEWCIKPTQNIRPNTTYYFKSNAGDQNTPLPSLTTAPGNFAAAPPPVLPNGGFESDLTDWTTASDNGSVAAFDINQTPNQIHGDSKALKVTVLSKGPAGSVVLSQPDIPLTDTGVYLLRFWALSDTRNALLDIELPGADGPNNHCHYQIYNRFDTTANGWQMYQYAVRVSSLSSPVSLKMQFNSNATYYLDDIELINQKTHPNIDFREQYNWQNNFSESYGWLSGDNNNPVLLPDGSVAWVLNDSFMGNIDPNSNVINSGHIINNLIVRQKGDSLSSVYKGSAPNAASLFTPGNGNLFWQSGGLIENNQLKVLLIEISDGNYTGSSWVGSLSLPDLKVLGLNKLPADINISPNCVLADGDYDYVYFGKSTGTFDMHTIVARVPAGQFDSQTPWEYYQPDGSWSTDYTNAKYIVDGVPAGNVLKLGDNNYVMSGVPHLSNEIAAWFAPTPYGPWGNKTVIYNIPSQEGILAYEGHLNPLSKDGYYSFTYSVYPFVTEQNGNAGSVPMQVAVKSTYLPIYTRAKLVDLSPYSNRKPADSLFSFTASLQTGTVQLNWTAAQSTNDHFQVQRSPDGAGWSEVTSIAGADSIHLATYAATDPSPATGLNYYRLAIYNMDHQLSYSPVLKVNTEDALSVGLSRFTASREDKAGGPTVRLDWPTVTELDHDHTGFTVERSSDNLVYSPIGLVSGAGNSTVENHYTYYDTSPLTGVNYYRLRYQSGSRPVTSDVRSVRINIPMSGALKVYPNPTRGKISFNFTAGQGAGTTGSTTGAVKEKIHAQLMDMAGKVILKQSFATSPDGHYELKGRPAAGIYLLQVLSGNLKQSAKVIIQ